MIFVDETAITAKDISGDDGHDSFVVAVKCARTCKNSLSKADFGPTDTTMMRALLKAGHMSVFEPWTRTYLTAAPVFVYSQLNRHRHLSPFQRSMRYCRAVEVYWPSDVQLPHEIEVMAYNLYNKVQSYVEQNNCMCTRETMQRLIGDAKMTEAAYHMNFREWLHVVKERLLNSHAQREIRILVGKMYLASPVLWKDFTRDRYPEIEDVLFEIGLTNKITAPICTDLP